MNNSQWRGLFIIVCSIAALFFSFQLHPATILVPAAASFVLLTYGVLIVSKKVQLVQKPFSIISVVIGISIGAIITIFIFSLKQNEKSKDRRLIENELQGIKKTSQTGMFFMSI